MLVAGFPLQSGLNFTFSFFFLRFHYYLSRFRCFAPPLHYVYFFIGLHFVSPNAINFATSWLLYFVKIFNSFFNNYVFNIRFLRSRLYWVLIFSHTLRSYGTIKNFKISDKSRLVLQLSHSTILQLQNYGA